MSEGRQQEVTEHDVFISRSFAAPRDTVWRFWTEPQLLASWFGPEGVHVPVDSIIVELVEQGRWELTMVDNATGAGHPIRGRIMEPCCRVSSPMFPEHGRPGFDRAMSPATC